MTLLSRKLDYALLILAFLYYRSGGGSAREIAGWFGLSRAFVANILKELCHQGFVSSQRGVKGGYSLERPMQHTSLADLMDALGEPFYFAECNRVDPVLGCSFVHVCPIQGPIAEIHNRMRDVLRNVKLADLFPSALSVGSEQARQLIALQQCDRA
jgi:Rrf2 family protein